MDLHLLFDLIQGATNHQHFKPDARIPIMKLVSVIRS